MKSLFCRAAAAAATEAPPTFLIKDTSLPEELGSHQVRVRVKACGLRALDLQLLRDVGLPTELIPVGRDVAGVVLRVGPGVSCFQPEDEVVGILPLDCPCSGLCEVIDVDEYCLVQKPEKLSWACAAGSLCDAVCAYTALHAQARAAAGHSLLVMDGGSPFGLMCVQLAAFRGLKVLTTSNSPQEHAFLEQLRPAVGVQEPLVARVVPVHSGGDSDLLSAVLEETGGLGVDIVVDCGVRLYDDDEQREEKRLLPHKHDIISVLGVGGRWVTSHRNLQLDPPDCRLLHLKSASVSFLNAEVWTASSAQQGRYLHILRDIVEKMAAGVLRPRQEEAVPLYEATVAMETVQRQPRRRVVVQL